MKKQLCKRQWETVLKSRRYGTARLLFTNLQFGYSRCITVGEGNDRKVLRSQTVIRRSEYEAYQSRGGFYRAGDFATLIWI